MRSLLVFTSIFLAGAIAGGCSRDPNVVKREYIASGDDYMKKGKYAEAVIQYANAVRRDSQFGEARFKLAEAHLAAGDKRAAMPEFIRAADLLKNDVEAQLRAGHMLLSGGLFEEARNRARDVLTKDPENAVALVMLGNALAGLKELPDAARVLERAVSIDPERAGILANLAVLEMARGRNAEAEAAFKKAVEVSHGSPDTQLALANFYRASKRLDEAERVLKVTHAQVPRSVPVNQALAAIYVETGRVADAEPFIKVVADIQKDVPSRLALAAYYVSANRDADAMATLNALAEEPSHFAEARIQVSMLHFMRGRRGEATKVIDGVLARQPNNAKALTVKARLKLLENKPEDAQTYIERALKIDPSSPDAHLTLGRVHLALSRPDDARKAFNETIQLDPESIPAHLELSKLHLKRDEIETAILMADDAVKSSRGSLPARLALARALIIRDQDRIRAMTELRALVAAYPKNPAVHTTLGAFGLANDDLAAARSAFNMALQLDPESVEALTGLVSLDISEKKIDQARQRVETLVAKNPRATRPLLLAANVYGVTGDAAKAEGALKRALELDPSDPSVYSQLGSLYIRQNRSQEAIDEFKLVAQLQPHAIGAPTMIGLLYYANGKLADAQQWWEKAIQIDPHAAAAAANLAWLYAEKNENLDVALQLAQIARAAHPEEVTILDTLGWVYYRKNMAALSASYFEQCIEKDPNNPLYHYHLGKSLAHRGEDGKARRALQQALDLNPRFEQAKDARDTLATLVF